MHRGCFVWTPTPPLSGRRTPRPGSARVCMCVPCLAGSVGPASWARFGLPHLSFGRSWCALCLFGPLWAGVAPFVVAVGFFLFFLFLFPFSPSLRPCCVLLCVFSGPGCPGPWRPVSPPPFFFPLPGVSGVSCFPVALGLCAPPPPFFFLGYLLFLFPFFLFFFLFFSPSFFAGCAVRGGVVCLGPSGVPW